LGRRSPSGGEKKTIGEKSQTADVPKKEQTARRALKEGGLSKKQGRLEDQRAKSRWVGGGVQRAVLRGRRNGNTEKMRDLPSSRENSVGETWAQLVPHTCRNLGLYFGASGGRHDIANPSILATERESLQSYPRQSREHSTKISWLGV